MHKEKKDKYRNYYMIIATFLLVFGAAWAVYGHFAKSSIVEAGFEKAAKTMAWVEERLAIGTHDQRVHQQEEELTRAKNRLRFQKKSDKPTREEEEDVVVQEKRLEDCVKQRRELIEEYKSKK